MTNAEKECAAPGQALKGGRKVRRVHRVEAEHTAKGDGYVVWELADQRDGIFRFDKSML